MRAASCTALLLAIAFAGCVEETDEPDVPIPTSPTGWRVMGQAVSGLYADAEAYRLADGSYRMLYGVQPDVPGNRLELYSATSPEARTWTHNPEPVRDWATFPDVVALPEGGFRLYYTDSTPQGSYGIRSMRSVDGVTWVDEPGDRIARDGHDAYGVRGVGASTTHRIGSDWIMIYRGTIEGKHHPRSPFPNTELFLWATSADGLTFERKGILLDSRDEAHMGFVDGPEFAQWTPSELRVYYWTPRGMYHRTFADGSFSAPVLDYDPDTRFESGPGVPGDPALLRVGDAWLLYYGIYQKGLHHMERPHDA